MYFYGKRVQIIFENLPLTRENKIPSILGVAIHSGFIPNIEQAVGKLDKHSPQHKAK